MRTLCWSCGVIAVSATFGAIALAGAAPALAAVGSGVNPAIAGVNPCASGPLAVGVKGNATARTINAANAAMSHGASQGSAVNAIAVQPARVGPPAPTLPQGCAYLGVAFQWYQPAASHIGCYDISPRALLPGNVLGSAHSLMTSGVTNNNGLTACIFVFQTPLPVNVRISIWLKNKAVGSDMIPANWVGNPQAYFSDQNLSVPPDQR